MIEKHGRQDPLVEMLRAQREEIEKYRWLESEKSGEDIGWERAAEEWKRKHLTAWKRSQQQLAGEHSVLAIIRFQQDEIEQYKWIESEKSGFDIGWSRAVMEWQEKHYPEWRSYALQAGLDSRPRKELEPTDVAGVAVGPQARRARRPLSDAHRQRLSASVSSWWERKRVSNTGRVKVTA
jgi:hypothetical protein